MAGDFRAGDFIPYIVFSDAFFRRNALDLLQRFRVDHDQGAIHLAEAGARMTPIAREFDTRPGLPRLGPELSWMCSGSQYRRGFHDMLGKDRLSMRLSGVRHYSECFYTADHCRPVNNRIDSVGCKARPRVFRSRCSGTLAARASSRTG